MDTSILVTIQQEINEAESVFSSWYESQKAVLEDTQKAHLERIAAEQDNEANLMEEAKKVEAEQSKRLQVQKKQAEEVAVARKEVTQLTGDSSIVVARRKALEDEKKALERQLAGAQTALEAEQREISLKMKEFQKGTQFYKERLGLEFERDGQSHLSFVFRNIDIDQCSKPFSITFEIDQNDCYIVFDCSPMVNGLSAMVDELNATNQLSTFLKKLRKKFKETL